jgi:malonyl-CoA O-methyltransferase
MTKKKGAEMKKEKPEWKDAKERSDYLKEILNKLEIAISQKNLKWAEKDIQELIAHAAIVGKKLQIGDIIDKGKDLLLKWHYQKEFKKFGVTEKIVGTKELYKLWAKGYEKIENPMFELEKGRFIPLLGVVKGKKILDLGCGTGRNSVPLAKKGALVYGIDFSREMLNEARKKAKKSKVKIEFKRQNITKRLPYSNESFDIVIADLVFNHIKNLKLLLKEISRVLKPEGFCLASDVHPYFVGPEEYGKIPFVTPLGLWLKERYEHNFSEYLDAVNKVGLKWEIFEYAREKGKRPLLLISKITKKRG